MKTDSLRPSQVMTILAIASMGVDILIVQRTMSSYVGRSAWISLLLGGVFGISLGSILYYLGTLYPDKDFPQIVIEIGGKFIGRLLMIPVILYVLLHTGLSINIFSQALKMFLLDRTPMYAIVIVMVAVVIFAVYKGIYSLSGVIDIIFPIAIVTIVTLILLSLQQAELANIKPVLYKNHVQVLKGSVLGMVQFTGYGHIAYILCYTHGSKGCFKWYAIGTAIPVVLYVALTLVTIMAFNPMGVESLIFPTLTLSKSIEFPVTFLERLESFITILWISIAFGSISLFTFASVRNFFVFFRAKKESLVTLIHLPLLITVALFIKNGMKVIEYYFMLNYLLGGLMLVLIPMLGIAAIFKKRLVGKK